MDTLSEVLDDIRSAGALLGKNVMSPPWSIRFAEEASMTLVSMLRGESWILTGDAEPVHLSPHDVAIVTGAEAFEVASDTAQRTSPLYVQTAAGVCTDEQGSVLDEQSIRLGVRTCGTDLTGSHALLTGTYSATGRVAERLLGALPRVIVVPRDASRSVPLTLLEGEIVRDAPGQQVVLDRLLDLVLAGTLRDWFALPDVRSPAWYDASADAVVGPALAAIHENPARRWTVDALAGTAGVSRATFARRFHDLMGEGPISYLTSWRLCLAADMISGSDLTLESVARRVGYSSAYALSAAFMREYDIRPSAHRALATG